MTAIQLRLLPGLLLLAVVIAGCAPSASSGAGRQSNELSRADIEATQLPNLYDAIDRLRPRWLTVRAQRSFGQQPLATEVVVYQNQTMLGGVEVLRQLGPEAAVRITYLDGATASASLPGLGSRHVEGAIILHTRER